MEAIVKFINRKLTLVTFIGTLCILYPNFICFWGRIAQLDYDAMKVGFLTAYTLIKFGIIWILLSSLMKYNLGTALMWPIKKRFGYNALITLVVYVVNVLLFFAMKPHGAFEDSGSVLVLQYLMACFISTLVGHIVMMYMEEYNKELEIEQLKSQSIQSQYNALSNQINPHFFFNSLNGISSLVRKHNDDKTLEYIGHLSDTFRYILKSGEKNLVPLSDELNFLNALSKVIETRYGGNLRINININDNDREQWQMPSLALLPLIDNVMVHNQIDDQNEMVVDINIDDDSLKVTNPIHPRAVKPDSNGTGLANLSNRTKLLTGKDITIEQNNDTFTIHLPLIKK